MTKPKAYQNVMKRLKNNKNLEKPPKNKLNLNTKKINNLLSRLKTFKIKVQTLKNSERYNDFITIIKEIVTYGLIIYPIFHLIFIRTSWIMNLLGCGATYYMFRDLFDYVIKKISEERKK